MVAGGVQSPFLGVGQRGPAVLQTVSLAASEVGVNDGPDFLVDAVAVVGDEFVDAFPGAEVEGGDFLGLGLLEELDLSGEGEVVGGGRGVVLLVAAVGVDDGDALDVLDVGQGGVAFDFFEFGEEGQWLAAGVVAEQVLQCLHLSSLILTYS